MAKNDDVVPLVAKKSPYVIARDLSAIFSTEFSSKRPEWAQPLVTAFGGTGRVEEGKLRYLCAGTRINRTHLTELVTELVFRNLLDEFFIDDAAIDLLSWGTIGQACETFLKEERQARQKLRQARINAERMQLRTQMRL